MDVFSATTYGHVRARRRQQTVLITQGGSAWRSLHANPAPHLAPASILEKKYVWKLVASSMVMWCAILGLEHVVTEAGTRNGP